MTSLRSLGWQWFLRLAGIILTIAILGITAGEVRVFYQAARSPPGKLSYNLAVPIISFFALFYLISATSPTPKIRLLSTSTWVQVAFDALMFALWLATAITSNLNCNDLCEACSSKPEISYGNSSCKCFASCGEPDWDGSSGQGWIGVLKHDLDIVVTILFLICLIADLYRVIKALRIKHTTTTVPPPTATVPIKHERADKATFAAGALLQYLFHGANVESGRCQAPRPLTLPKYPQSAHHQQYFHGSVTAQRTGTSQQDSNVEPMDGTAEIQAYAQPTDALV